LAPDALHGKTGEAERIVKDISAALLKESDL
jgi:hypothetical protein